MCTGTPYLKSGSGQSVPVHPKCVPIHLSRKLAVEKVYQYTINVYRYTCMRSAGIEQKCDPNAGAYLSIILEHEMTLERSIKAIGHKEKAAFVFPRFRFSEEKSFSPYFELKFVDPD